MSVRALRRGAIAASRVTAPPAGNVTGLILPGTSGNYVSTPDTAAVSTGNPDLRLKITLPDWDATYSFASKYGAAGQISWRFRMFVKFPAAVKSANGTATDSTNAGSQVSYSDGQTRWLRMVYNSGSGTIEFLTSTDGSTWSTHYFTTWTTGLFDSTAPLVLGAGDSAGTVEPMNGTIHYADLRNGKDGPIVAKFDPTTVTRTATRTPTSFVSSTGETWTVSGSAWDWAT